MTRSGLPPTNRDRETLTVSLGLCKTVGLSNRDLLVPVSAVSQHDQERGLRECRKGHRGLPPIAHASS